MTFATSPRAARAWRGLRFAGLVLIALFAAHDALFAARYGLGPAMDEAMAAGGHGGWWTPYALLVLGVTIAIGAGATLRLRRLTRLGADAGISGGRPDPGGYARELLGLWRALFPVVAVLLVVQENVESLAAAGRAVGLEPVASPVALLAIVLASLGVAAAGALVRWRIRVIEARLVAARRRAWARRSSPSAVLPSWLTAAILRHRWLLLRDDPGRAPPSPIAPG